MKTNINLCKITIVALLGVIAAFVYVFYEEITYEPYPSEIDKIVEEVKYEDPELKIMTEYIYNKQERIDMFTAQRIAEAILDVAMEYSIPQEILIAIADVESNFRPWAISNKNAVGLMQIIYDLHKDLIEKKTGNTLLRRDLFIPRIAVESAAIILNEFGFQTSPETAIKKYFGYTQNNNIYITKIYTAMGKYMTYKKKLMYMEEKQGE